MPGAHCTLLRYARSGLGPALGLGTTLLAALLGAGPAAADPTVPAAGRRTELIRLVLQDCGSCHGMTLKGGLGPALTPEALRERPVEILIAAILSGRPGTPMPPWRSFVSMQDAAWIVDQLQKGLIHAP